MDSASPRQSWLQRLFGRRKPASADTYVDNAGDDSDYPTDPEPPVIVDAEPIIPANAPVIEETVNTRSADETAVEPAVTSAPAVAETETIPTGESPAAAPERSTDPFFVDVDALDRETAAREAAAKTRDEEERAALDHQIAEVHAARQAVEAAAAVANADAWARELVGANTPIDVDTRRELLEVYASTAQGPSLLARVCAEDPDLAADATALLQRVSAA